MKIRVLLLILIATLGAACDRGNIQVDRNGNSSASITVTLTEAEFNSMINDALAGSNPLLRDPIVDFQPGQIIISGEHERRAGAGRVSGTLTMTLSVQNGALLAQITAVNIEGLDLTDARITEFNQRLAERMTQRAGRDNPILTVQSVTVTADNVQVVFEARRG